MVFSLSAPIHIPSSMLLKAHANHHLEACEHDIGHSRQEQNPEEPPWEGIIWKMSSIDRSQHPDNLMPKTRRSTKIAIQNQKKKKTETQQNQKQCKLLLFFFFFFFFFFF